jgi:AcrR family transcriptional regulator
MIDAEPSPKRPRGRPNDAAIDQALLKAAYDEFMESGYHGMTMESVAARAGVSKVSLYRRWDNKAAIMGELFRGMGNEPVEAEADSLEGFIRALIRASMAGPGARDRGKLVLRTIGEIAADPELLALYREHILMPRLDQLRGVIDAARARGELRGGVSTDVACAAIAGPLLLCSLALLAEADFDLSGAMAGQLTRLLMDGLDAET